MTTWLRRPPTLTGIMDQLSLRFLTRSTSPSGPQISPSVFHSRMFKGCIGTVPVGRVEPGYGCHLCTLASVLDMIRDRCIKIQKQIKWAESHAFVEQLYGWEHFRKGGHDGSVFVQLHGMHKEHLLDITFPNILHLQVNDGQNMFNQDLCSQKIIRIY